MTNASPIDLYYAAEPARFRLLRDVRVSQQAAGGPPWEATVRIELADREGTESLVLTFAGVTELVLQPHGMPMSIGILDIEDVGDRQWEGVRYRVRDTEQEETFSCLCAGFTVERP